MIIKRNIIARMVVTSLLFLLFSCVDRNADLEEVPMAPVTLSIDLYHEGHHLLEPLSYIICREPRMYGEHLGHAGILIVHNMLINHPYSAYDLLCPYDYPDIAVIEVHENKGALLSGICPKCHTVYNLTMGVGDPIHGVAKKPLIQYEVLKQNTHLIIHN